MLGSVPSVTLAMTHVLATSHEWSVSTCCILLNFPRFQHAHARTHARAHESYSFASALRMQLAPVLSFLYDSKRLIPLAFPRLIPVQLASGGRAVVTTIHQPSSRLYRQLDMVMLLAEGHVMFYGDASMVRAMHTSMPAHPCWVAVPCMPALHPSLKCVLLL